MSDDPLDETIRGKQDKLTIDGIDVPVWLHEDVPQDSLILVEAGTLIHSDWLDGLKRVGWGTCHIQGPDGKMRLVSVSIVSQRAIVEAHAQELTDIWQKAAQIEYKDGAGRPWPDAAREWDARGAEIRDGEGNLIIDDLNAIPPEESARREMYASWPAAPDFRSSGSWLKRAWARLRKFWEMGE